MNYLKDRKGKVGVLDVSFVSEGNRICLSFQSEGKGRGKLGSECDFGIGRKINEEK